MSDVATITAFGRHHDRGAWIRFLLPLLLSGAAVMSLIAVVVWAFYDARQAAQRQAEQHASNIALALDGDISRLFDRFDQMLQSAIVSLQTPTFAALDPVTQRALLVNPVRSAGTESGIAVADETGNVIASTVDPVGPRFSFSERPFFEAHRNQNDLGLYFSPPLRSQRDGKSVLVFSRRINHLDGSFGGVVVGRVELHFFKGLFDQFDLGSGGNVSLAGNDGIIVARQPDSRGNTGPEFLDHPLRAEIANGVFRPFVHVSSADGVSRIGGFRKVTGYPFVIGVAFADSEIYAEWNRGLRIFGGILVVFVSAAAAVTASSLKYAAGQRRSQRAAAVAETERAVAHERLQTVFQNSADSKLIASIRGPSDIVYETVNPVWEGLTGVPAADAVGRTPHECLPPGLADLVIAKWRQCLQRRAVVTFSFSSPDGREWEARLVPIIDSAGDAHRLIATARDITERNGLMRSLEGVNEQLESLNGELETRVQCAVVEREEAFTRASTAERLQALGQLAGGIAHDFNNILQSVSGCATLILRRSHDPAACERLATIAAEATERGASITHRLLAFSRQDALRSEAIDVRAMFENLSVLLTHTLGSSISIEMDADPAVPSVMADKSQLETVLLNLATNARDAMPAGGTLTLAAVAATVAAGSEVVAGHYVKLSVSDTGSGMDRATLARVTEPFFTTKPVGQGTGLGLSMAKGFADQSQGALTIASEPGQGTVVTLWLPEAGQRADAADGPVRIWSPGQTLRSRILLVEDEASVRETMAEELGQTFDVRCAASGQEALALLGTDGGFGLMVTDLTMPGMDGIALIREARRRQPDLLVILLTGYAGDLAPLTASGGVSGSVSIVRKPVTGTKLGDLIDALTAAAAHSDGSEALA